MDVIENSPGWVNVQGATYFRDAIARVPVGEEVEVEIRGVDGEWYQYGVYWRAVRVGYFTRATDLLRHGLNVGRYAARVVEQPRSKAAPRILQIKK